jgi:hypothetical protein
MNRPFAFLLFAIPAMVAVGCAKPDLDLAKIRIGMTRSEIIARVGQPTKTTVNDHSEIFEYEAYDRYGALIVNRRSQFIRFMNGKVESFGNIEDLHPPKPPTGKVEGGLKADSERQGETVHLKAGPPAPGAFDLRTELEKLEQLKKDGLISDVEFKELRQRVLEKAKAQ